ncbi:MAG: hypothetical protein KBB51_03005 [Candidatus Moranbacteria bacterium]|nr:hypothetical protein [Candidatus Moranbacteria bacterium]
MWHLIVPPIIVVICFVLIVWYLSLRGSDPEVAERVEAIGDVRGGALRLRARIFSLRVLEKIAQRSKLLSLRIYNGIHEFLQSVKEKRKLSDMRQQELETAVQEKDLSQPEDFRGDEVSRELGEEKRDTEAVQKELLSARVFKRDEIAVEANVPEEKSSGFNIATPIRRRPKEDVGKEGPSVLLRPMVSDQAVRPEKLKRKVLERPAEEELIARIATNPKDYTAYESLGDFYMERGSIQDAKECYKQVLKLSPVQRLVKIKIRRLERLLSQR